MSVKATSEQLLNVKISPSKPDHRETILNSHDSYDFGSTQNRSRMFSNGFLNFIGVGSILNNAAESFFKSEIRRRLFVTAVLTVTSRIRYFIPLPGFDRKLIPQDYLSFVSGSAGDFSTELKLSLPSDYSIHSYAGCCALLAAPYALTVMSVFAIVTTLAVVVTEGCRKVKLQYSGFKLASAARDDSPIMKQSHVSFFTINPAGMQPILTITNLLAFPSIIARLIIAFFVFLFNIFDIANLPKEISDWLNKKTWEGYY